MGVNFRSIDSSRNDVQNIGGILKFQPGGSISGAGFAQKGDTWYVDGTSGDDDYNGESWTTAFKTIAVAVAAAAAGDTIFLIGSFNEAVTCALAGVEFIGAGTGPAQATWTAPTVAGSHCLKLTAGYCVVKNIKFRPVIYTGSGLPCGIHLVAASSYTRILDCRFQGRAGSYAAIYCSVPCGNVEIDNCEFLYMNTLTHGKAIYGLAVGGSAHSAWRITNCIFNSCLADINIDGRTCLLEGNKHFIVGLAANGTFASAVTTTAIDLSGTDTGANMVTKNTLGGLYTTALYIPGATGDVWMGNFADITDSECLYGLTTEEPTS